MHLLSVSRETKSGMTIKITTKQPFVLLLEGESRDRFFKARGYLIVI